MPGNGAKVTKPGGGEKSGGKGTKARHLIRGGARIIDVRVPHSHCFMSSIEEERACYGRLGSIIKVKAFGHNSKESLIRNSGENSTSSSDYRALKIWEKLRYLRWGFLGGLFKEGLCQPSLRAGKVTMAPKDWR